MTTSVPAPVPATGPSAPLPHPEVGRPGRTRLAVLNVSSRLLLRLLPRLPDAVKRVLLGLRTVTIDGNTLDTTLQLMLAAQRSAGVSGLVASSDIGVARSQLRTLSGMLDTGIAARVRTMTVPGPAGPMPARHYSPVQSPAGQSAPLLVFFHGGGFVVGDLDTHDGLCRLICRDAGVHVLAIEYRLAPEHQAPAAIEDCYSAYRWALEQADRLASEPSRVAVGGDSAGGNLAAVVTRLARRDGVQLPALQLLLYPVTNFAGETRSKSLFADGYFLTKKDMDWFEGNYLAGAAIDVADA